MRARRSADVAPARVALSALAWSPDGRTIAAGDEQGALRLVGVRGYDGAPVSSREASARHASAVLTIDWSADGMLMRTNCAARELRFWDAASGEPVAPARARGVAWATCSCALSAETIGAADRADGDSRPTCAARTTGERDSGGGAPLLLVGDDLGALSLYAHPADAPGAERRRVNAHGGPICAVAVTGGSAVASLGARDGAVLVWAA